MYFITSNKKVASVDKQQQLQQQHIHNSIKKLHINYGNVQTGPQIIEIMQDQHRIHKANSSVN